MHYPDLNALLRSEPEAKHYFDTLPDYAREQISTRADGVQRIDHQAANGLVILYAKNHGIAPLSTVHHIIWAFFHQ